MSVFLTPDLHPFFGGTYFPPKDAYGRPGFPTVLQRVAEVWRTRREEVSAQGADVMRQLAEMSEPEVGAALAGRSWMCWRRGGGRWMWVEGELDVGGRCKVRVAVKG